MLCAVFLLPSQWFIHMLTQLSKSIMCGKQIIFRRRYWHQLLLLSLSMSMSLSVLLYKISGYHFKWKLSIALSNSHIVLTLMCAINMKIIKENIPSHYKFPNLHDLALYLSISFCLTHTHTRAHTHHMWFHSMNAKKKKIWYWILTVDLSASLPNPNQ